MSTRTILMPKLCALLIPLCYVGLRVLSPVPEEVLCTSACAGTYDDGDPPDGIGVVSHQVAMTSKGNVNVQGTATALLRRTVKYSRRSS